MYLEVKIPGQHLVVCHCGYKFIVLVHVWHLYFFCCVLILKMVQLRNVPHFIHANIFLEILFNF